MQSMDHIYQSYAQTVYKYLLSLSGESDIAEELTQETFYQAIRSIDRFDESCKISTWLCAIAKNQFYAYLRKHPPQENYEEHISNSAAQPVQTSVEEQVFAETERVNLLKGLHSCKEPYREIIYLRFFGNLNFKQIGEIMGKTETWARVNFYRGKEMLRKELEKDEL